MYSMRCWSEWFPRDDPKTGTIKVYMCGLMDFSPIQHAAQIGWILGALYLADICEYSSQGCGLPIVNEDKLREYCQKNSITY